jgi:hypothetical protein
MNITFLHWLFKYTGYLAQTILVTLSNRILQLKLKKSTMFTLSESVQYKLHL